MRDGSKVKVWAPPEPEPTAFEELVGDCGTDALAIDFAEQRWLRGDQDAVPADLVVHIKQEGCEETQWIVEAEVRFGAKMLHELPSELVAALARGKT